ncbi:MAG TPA: hypothetical protein VEH48_01585 [Candidatus Nitrosopolaris sp.]|nr:hypothetical protein [Candidatus Nitrosopolaris sp.]
MPPEDEQQPLPEAAAPREHVGPDYHRKENRSHKALIVTVILVLLIGGGTAAWYQKHRSDNQKQAKAIQQLQAQQQAVANQIDSKTKSYTSPNFYLTFSYPADWTISDNGNGLMSAVSPAIKLKNAIGQSVTGQIELLIRNTTNKLSEFSAGNATAVFDSQKITYTDPTPNQRAQTYLSFLQYASSTSGLDGIYITSDNGYTRGQAIPLVDVSQENPIIDIVFNKCANDVCSGKTTPLSIEASSWNDAGFSTPLVNMLKSLSIT